MVWLLTGTLHKVSRAFSPYTKVLIVINLSTNISYIADGLVNALVHLSSMVNYVQRSLVMIVMRKFLSNEGLWLTGEFAACGEVVTWLAGVAW